MSTEIPAAPVTEPPKSVFDQAREAVAQSEKDQGAAPVSDDTPPDTQPAEDTDKVADQPEETTDTEDAILSTEELAALPPQERKKAEKWVAKLTRQSQELSATKRDLEEWKTLVEALKNDPDAAIRQLAERRGLKFVQEAPAQDTVQPIPEELKFLEPIFAAREKAIKAELEAKYGRLEERVDTMSAEAAAAETESTIAQFTAKYPDWKKHEARMLELGQEFIPAKPMSDYKYMEHLHTLATAKINEAEQVKKTVEKINKSVASAEPPQSGVPNHRVEVTRPSNWSTMNSRERLEAAHAAAKRGEHWVK